MKNNFLSLLITLLMLIAPSIPTMADCPNNSSISNCQKACKNIISLINLDLAILSPKASIADFCLSGPKTTCCKQAMQESSDTKETMATAEKQDAIIPVTNTQETIKQADTKSKKNKLSVFRVDLFRLFKIQLF